MIQTMVLVLLYVLYHAIWEFTSTTIMMMCNKNNVQTSSYEKREFYFISYHVFLKKQVIFLYIYVFDYVFDADSFILMFFVLKQKI
jgi:hypothetical protein